MAWKIKKTDIDFNIETGFPMTQIAIVLEDPNGMILKAKAQFVIDTVDRLMEIIEAQEQLFEEMYGQEAVRHIHFDIDKCNPMTIVTMPRGLWHKEIRQKLLDKAFENADENFGHGGS